MGSAKPRHGFTNVDGQRDPQRWIACLDLLHAHPFFAAYKQRIRELLNPRHGARYLEIGCGTGDAARALAHTVGAAVVALDSSRAMAAEARARGLAAVVVGSASALPFREGSFDGCWADRVFQHLDAPDVAVGELLRVTRPGGRLVAVDPDYGTQVMSFPDSRLAEKVLRFRARHGLRNGTLAGQMAQRFEELGLSQVQREARTLRVRDATALDSVFGLRSWGRSAQQAGFLRAGEAECWEQLFDEIVARGSFSWQVDYFLTAGTKPAR